MEAEKVVSYSPTFCAYQVSSDCTGDVMSLTKFMVFTMFSHNEFMVEDTGFTYHLPDAIKYVPESYGCMVEKGVWYKQELVRDHSPIYGSKKWVSRWEPIAVHRVPRQHRAAMLVLS